jgi:hypothetical protein
VFRENLLNRLGESLFVTGAGHQETRMTENHHESDRIGEAQFQHGE